MKYKLLLIILMLLAGADAYPSYVYASDLKNLKEGGRLKHVVNTNKLLTAREADRLNIRLDSVYQRTGLDISLVLLSGKSAALYETSDKFAESMHTYLKSDHTYGPDYNLIIVYDNKTNDLGYHIGSSIQAQIINSLLVRKKTLFRGKGNIKKNDRYSTFFLLINDIEKLYTEEMEIYKKQREEEEEANKKKEEAIQKSRAEIESKGVDYTILYTILTLICLYFWIRRKGRMARERAFHYESRGVHYVANPPRTYLNEKRVLISLFFFFVYPLIIVILTVFLLLGVDLEPGVTFKDMPHLINMITAFMFLGWLPTTILIEIEKRRVSGSTQSRVRTPRRQTRSSLERLESEIRRNREARQHRQTTNTPINSQEVEQQAPTRNGASPKININTAVAQQIRNISPLITILEANNVIKERELNGDYKNKKDLQKRNILSASLINIISERVSFESTSNSSKKPSGRVIDF